MTYNFTTPANGSQVILTIGTPVSGTYPVTPYYGTCGNTFGMGTNFSLASDANFQKRAHQMDLHLFRIHGGTGTGGLAGTLFPTNTTIVSTAIDPLLTVLGNWMNTATDRLLWTFGQAPSWLDLTTSGGRTSYATCAVNLATYVHNTYGFDFTYWEPLNEPDGTALSEANYIATWNAVSTALKTYNASYKVGGPTISFYSSSYLATFLASCTPDFISWHNYYPAAANQLADAYLGWAGGSVKTAVTTTLASATYTLHFADTTGLYPYMLVTGTGISGTPRILSLTPTTVLLDSTASTTQTIASGTTLTFTFAGYGANCLSAQTTAVAASMSAGTPLFIGEHNMNFSSGGSEEPLQTTITGAVFEALVLYSSLTSGANVTMSNWYDIAEDSTFGIVQGASGSTYTISPVGYFLSYFANHMPGTVVTNTIGAGATNLRCLTTSANILRNSQTAGATAGLVGSGGVLPTDWSTSFGSVTGISVTVVGSGTDATTGLPYVDLQYSGTPSASGTLNTFFDASAPATSLTAYTTSCYIAFNAGALTNTTSWQLQANSLPSFDGAGDTSFTPSGTLTCITTTGSTHVSATGIECFFAFNVVASSAINVTFRFAGAMCQTGSVATAFNSFGCMLVNFDDTSNYRVSIVGAGTGPYSYYELSNAHQTGSLTSMGSLSGLTIPAMSVVFVSKP